ncbi:hypothetical protein B566_EDAN008918 [Ephemera danica]|nr:hypothetical protein B566_EDAN008918 [Ephemera danica]
MTAKANKSKTMRLINFLILTSLAVCAMAQSPNYRILCSKLKPVHQLDISQLSGSWLTVESLLLKDGFPQPPENPRRRVCVRSNLSDVTKAGLSMTSEVRIGASRRRTGRTKFVVSDPQQPGRWDMQTKRPSSLNSEILVLAAQPREFMVLAFCQPMRPGAEEGDPQPALWVKILARESSLARRELSSLRQHVSHMLGLHDLATVMFDTSC